MTTDRSIMAAFDLSNAEASDHARETAPSERSPPCWSAGAEYRADTNAGVRRRWYGDPLLATCESPHDVGADVVITVGPNALLLVWRGYADRAPRAPSGAPLWLRETSLGRNRLRPACRQTQGRSPAPV